MGTTIIKNTDLPVHHARRRQRAKPACVEKEQKKNQGLLEHATVVKVLPGSSLLTSSVLAF
jgi:hypothetical protein